MSSRRLRWRLRRATRRHGVDVGFQFGPAGEPVFASEGMLDVRQLRAGHAHLQLAQPLARLFLEMFEIWTGWRL
jgi:hypothetical protein